MEDRPIWIGDRPLQDADRLVASEPEEPTAPAEDLSGREPYDPDAEQAELRQDTEARRRALGTAVGVEGEVAQTWLSPMDAFLSDLALETPKRTIELTRPNGWATKLTVETLPTPRYHRIIRQHTKMVRDPTTGERIQDTDERAVKAQLVVDSIKEIDFNDPRLWDRFGASDPHDLVERMFYRGEIERIALLVSALSGFKLEELEEQAGNF